MNHASTDRHPKRIAPIAVSLCAVMLLGFAGMSWRAGASKAATYDEPLHAVGGFVHRYASDYRINPEDPALLGIWASLPQPRNAINIGADAEDWQNIPGDLKWQWRYVMRALYQTRDVDADRFVARSRAMFVTVGVLLGAVIAGWSWRLAGPIAATIATAFYSFDPNFLAHSAIVKNDVPMALLLCAAGYCIWLVGRRATWLNLLGVALTCGAAVSTKYTGLVLGPIVVITLLFRAMMPRPWVVMGIELRRVASRLLFAAGTCAAIALTSWLAIWACYGFRYQPFPDPKLDFNASKLILLAQANRAELKLAPGEELTDERVLNESPGVWIKSIFWLDRHELIPEAWVFGFIYTYATTITKPTFLLGQIYPHGTWLYFPLAMIFKTPLATIAAALASAVIAAAALIAMLRAEPDLVPSSDQGRARTFDAWTVVALVIPFAIFGLVALSSHFNVGIRHVLPLYPFLYIVIGVGFAWLLRVAPAAGKLLCGVLLAGLIIESLATFPDYLSFFNLACGGSRGGIRLLGDSNLDWGQDLKLLADWQRLNPNRQLYLCYFGIADPSYYGITATYAPGGWMFAEPSAPGGPGVLAVSANCIQGTLFPPELRKVYASLTVDPPIRVLGGSIFLYEYPPKRKLPTNFPGN